MKMLRIAGPLAAVILSLSIGFSSASADEFCRPCPFDCERIGAGHKDCRNLDDGRRGECCVDLNGRGQDLLHRQERDGGRGYDDRERDSYDFDEVCRSCPFDCRGIGAEHRDCHNTDGRRGECCVELSRYGKDQLRRKDDENSYRYDSRRRDPGAYDDKAGFKPGDCPSGFHVNDRLCNSDERHRGCKDMRSPSGQICVGWR